MARSKSRRIDDLSLADPLIRGIGSEEFVEEALQYLEQTGKIVWYERSDDSHDWLGIDFTIYLDCDGSIISMPLQVKSSFGNARIHRKKYHDIPCVVVEDDDDLSDVSNKIAIALNIDHPLVEQLTEELFLSLTYQYA